MLFHRIEGHEAARALAEGEDTDALTRLAGKPALLHLPGTDPGRPYRMISVLLHGNEDSGLRGLLAWLRDGRAHPNPLWVFIGNTRAASQEGWFADRYLPDQEDFNRVWAIHPVSNRMRRCAAEVMDLVTAEPLEAAVDIHNNTGDNPLYAILPRNEPGTRALAGALTEVGLLWGTQEHTLMQALEPYCPAVAVECGRAGVPAHAVLARAVIERFLALPSVHADMPGPSRTYEVQHRVEVRPEVSFDFAEELLDDEMDFAIRPGLDSANFDILPAGTEVGRIWPGSDLPLVVLDDEGEAATGLFFEVRDDGMVVVAHDLIPAMMTRTRIQTRRDCLFYVVEALD